MMEDKPFCIRGSKGRFWHGYEESGYLPALEKPSEPPYPQLPELKLSQYLTQKIKKLGELEGRLIHIQNKINEHIASSKEDNY